MAKPRRPEPWPKSEEDVGWLIVWEGRIVGSEIVASYDSACTKLEELFRAQRCAGTIKNWRKTGWIMRVTPHEKFAIDKVVPKVKYELTFLTNKDDFTSERVARAISGRKMQTVLETTYQQEQDGVEEFSDDTMDEDTW